jgi:hypothetical protein
MSEDIQKKAAEIIAKHYPDETPLELLKRLQQHLEFVANLPPKLFAFTVSPKTIQKNTTGITPLYNAILAQNALKPEHSPVLEVRNEMLEQFKEIAKIEHLEPAGRLKTILKS